MLVDELSSQAGGAAEASQPPSESPSEAAQQPRTVTAPNRRQNGRNGHWTGAILPKRGHASDALPSHAPELQSPTIPQPEACAGSVLPWRSRLVAIMRAARAVSAQLNWSLILLLALLAGALALRLYGLDWDDNTHQHPDERAIILTVINFQWPHSWAQFFSVNSPLSPHFDDGSHFFAYGTFPMYVLRQMGVFLDWLQRTFGFHWLPAGQTFSDYDHITLVGRALSALFDTGTVFVTYLLGRRLSKRKSLALLAAAFVAFTPFEVQLSHYFAVDTTLTFFVALALLSYVAVAQTGKVGWVILAGVASGLALASKFSALPLLLPLGVAYLLYWRRTDWRMMVPRACMSLGAGVLSFVIAMPYALIDFPDFQAAIKEQGDLAQGILDYPYTRQYAGTTPYVYEIKNILIYDMGVPLALLCFIGCLYIARRIWRSWHDEYLILLSWVLIYFGIIGSFYTKFSRYALPIFPVLCIFGAAALVALWRWGHQLAVRTAPEGGMPFAANVCARMRGVRRWLQRRARPLAVALGVIVIGCSLLFTLALDNIYSQPMTRVQASRWIYAHLPPGKTITYEIWDDSLPLPVDGQVVNYNFVGLPLYDDDTPQKAQMLSQDLAQADAVVIASNKLYPDSIPRLPARYPMTNRYYQLLFAGKLGFHLAAVFQNSPNLFGIYFNDSGADESFSVYDHPTVHIFVADAIRPTADQIKNLLTAGLTLPPPQADVAANQKLLTLTPAQIADNQSSAPLDQQFPAGNFANQHPLLTWWLLLEALGLLLFPLTAFLFRRFRDRGWAFAKTIGLLLVGLLVWLPASLHVLPYTEATTWGILIAVGLASLAVGWLTRADLKAFLRQRWLLLLGTEALFSAAFLFFVYIRMQDPDLWHIWRGGEKPMELAFLDGILRSRYFPPLDPWFAGGSINYYYYGQYLISILIRLTDILPTTAFNLAIPTLFALLLTSGFSLVSHLTRRWWAGLMGGFFVAMLGNLDGFHQLLAQWAAIQQHLPVPSFDYWASSRVIPYTINEFPFWSFLYADLHAHVIDLPIEALALGMAAAILSDSGEERQPRLLAVGRVLLLGLALGAMACINTWDVPTYALVILLALVCREYTLQRKGWLLSYAAVKRIALTMVGIAAGAYLFYEPFYANFQSFVGGIGQVSQPDQLADYTTLFGIWLFIAASFFFVELYQWAAGRLTAALAAGKIARNPDSAYSALFWALLLAYGLAVCFIFVYLNQLLQVLYGLLALGLVLFLVQGRGQRPGRQFTYLLILTALGISILVETIYVRDFLDNSDYERMNTVFKFFEQMWVFYALGGALAIFEMVRWAARARARADSTEYMQLALAEAKWDAEEAAEVAGPRHSRHRAGGSLWARGPIAWFEAAFLVRDRGVFPTLVRWTWCGGLAFLVLACSVFLVEGTQARIDDHAIWAQLPPPSGPVNSPNYLPTLDGLAYMDAWYPGDYEAIQWLNENVGGTPVILEDSCGGYQWCGRVSIYTGLPSVLGWDSHESQQRYPDEVYTRLQDVKTMYTTSDPAQMLELLHKYDVTYIYLGECELMGNQIPYCGGDPPLGQDALAKFRAMVQSGVLRVVYQNQYDTTIYEVMK